MASAASLDGISVNGLRWRAQLPIKSIIPVVPDIDDDQVIPAAELIDNQLKQLAPMLKKRVGIEIPDFELDLVETKDELIDALTQLYDWADYERVVIL